MTGVLGIDAAWTVKEPSGVALLEGSPGQWRCVTVTPSYDSFLARAEGEPVDWTSRTSGAIPDVNRLIAAAERLLGGGEVAIVTVNMPLATVPITGRRAADSAISRVYGSKGAAAHTPNAKRPGAIGARLSEDLSVAEFPLGTSTASAGTLGHLIEVYPHPALLTLTGASYRLCYKVAKSLKYWPGRSLAERKANLLCQFTRILTALRTEIRNISLELPHPSSVAALAGLKRYEDSLDALVCAWVGAKYLEGEAKPYGDDTAAIWVP